MNAERNSGARIIVGGQWGDEGKGLVSAYLAWRDGAILVAKAGVGPNAEHGYFVSEKGPYIRVNQLPLGWVFTPQSQIRIGSGVAVNPQLLLEEMEKFGLDSRVKIDFRCPIITPEHVRAEKESKGMRSIGSTCSGSGFCRADFILRKAQQAQDVPELRSFLTDVAREVNYLVEREVVIIESSQGTELSLALSSDYPNVTSDNVTAMAAADDVGLNWRKLRGVMMVVKTLPTREGAGSLGGQELSLAEIKRKSLIEYSSIGGAIRRKGTSINWEMLAYAAEINGATEMALTFCEHYDPRVRNIKDKRKITDRLWQLIERVASETGVPVTILNTGKPFDCIVDLSREGVIDWEQVRQELVLPKS